MTEEDKGSRNHAFLELGLHFQKGNRRHPSQFVRYTGVPSLWDSPSIWDFPRCVESPQTTMPSSDSRNNAHVQPPFPRIFPTQNIALTQSTNKQQGSSTMAGDTHILVSPFQAQTSDGKGDLLFEREVLDIQVGKGSKCFLFEEFKSAKISNLCGHGHWPFVNNGALRKGLEKNPKTGNTRSV